MRWLRKKHRRSEKTDVLIAQADPDESDSVNLDRRTIPLDNPHDATSLLSLLTLNYGAVYMRYDSKSELHHVTITNRGEWTGDTQLAALTAAHKELG